MKKFYKIPEKTLLNDWESIAEWLRALPRTKRGKDPYIFGNVMPGTISFTWKKDALAFVIRFGARLVTDEDRYKHRLGRGY
jgi:hypothetical protein